jgi:hypothetical protein
MARKTLPGRSHAGVFANARLALNGTGTFLCSIASCLVNRTTTVHFGRCPSVVGALSLMFFSNLPFALLHTFANEHRAVEERLIRSIIMLNRYKAVLFSTKRVPDKKDIEYGKK